MLINAAVQFFVDEVDPSARVFLLDFGNVWKGRCAAMMLTHTADHVWHHRKSDVVGFSSEDAFRDHLCHSNRDFALLCDVCNASKHAMLRARKPGKRQPLISSSGQVTADDLGWGEGDWGDLRYGGPMQVVVSLNDGRNRSVDGAVMRVHAMWCTMFCLSLPAFEQRASNPPTTHER